jgi:acetyl-CoA carboxylase biotin carboxyl carrier protein
MATDVKAHITGTVWKIEKGPGSSVAEGDTVIILESMKMEMPVEAPVGGTVREIKIKEGEAVDEGRVLAVIDEG